MLSDHRAVLTGLLLATLASGAAAQTCQERQPTRATGAGPHDYTFAVPEPRLWSEGDEGEPLFLRGRVIDPCGRPLADAQVQVLHANHHGGHEPDRWRARLQTDPGGAFQMVTVFPGYTGGIPRHIHFIISHPDHERLVTRLFFKNDPDVDSGIEDLALVLEEVRRGEGRGWVASYEFVLRPN